MRWRAAAGRHAQDNMQVLSRLKDPRNQGHATIDWRSECVLVANRRFARRAEDVGLGSLTIMHALREMMVAHSESCHCLCSGDLPPIVTQQIEHFFQHYKDLEPGKWAKLKGWGDAEEAKRFIVEAMARAKE